MPTPHGPELMRLAFRDIMGSAHSAKLPLCSIQKEPHLEAYLSHFPGRAHSAKHLRAVDSEAVMFLY